MKPNRSSFHAISSLLLCALLSACAQAQPAFTELFSPNNRAGAGFGVDFGGLPDLTRDGVGEFYAVGGFGGSSAYVFDGKSLEVVYSFGSAGCGAGSHTHSAGDLNGDGIPELMTGKGCSSTGIGSVGVINGATGELLFSLDSPNPVNQGYFGTTLRLLPDMTGDGKEDWLIHQPEWGSRSGRAYIFDSQTRKAIRTIQNTEADYRIWMRDVEVIPDVDGDGKPELLIAGAGRFIVRSLQTGLVLYELIDPEPQGSRNPPDALRGIGDITGDKVGDIAVGIFPKDDAAGAIYFFSGADGNWLRTLRSPNPQPNGRFGRDIEVLPDLNGDGVPELWTQEDEFQLTYVFDGATSGLLKTIEYPGGFETLFFTGIVRQTAAPGIRAYLFASEFGGNSNEGRVYFMPFTPLPKPPQLKPLGKSNTGFRLQVIGDAGSKVEIQSSGDFKTWDAISSVTLGNQATEVEDSAADSLAFRFYRAVQGP